MKPEERIRIGVLDVTGDLTFQTVDYQAHVLHDVLGGYMETFPLPRHLRERDLVAIADEDGNQKQLPYNPFSPLLGRQIVGRVLLVRSDLPEFVSLTDDDVEALREWFGQLGGRRF
jgi:hypothetical protein